MRCGGPDAPNTTGTFHFSEDEFVAFFADDAVAIAIGVPGNVFAGGLVVLAFAIVAGEKRGAIAGLRKNGETFEIGEAVN